MLYLAGSEVRNRFPPTRIWIDEALEASLELDCHQDTASFIFRRMIRHIPIPTG
jgi:hypothetical protein